MYFYNVQPIDLDQAEDAADAAVSAHESASDPHTGYQLRTERDQNDGYAGLDSNGKIAGSQLPAIAITDTFVVNSEAAMLALDTQVGDVAIRTDILKSFILAVEPATTLGNWQELLAPPGGGGGGEVRADVSGGYSYIGTALTGSAEGSAVWTITRIELSSPPVVTTAVDVAWTNRGTASYS
jgi:hypothetical protein